ncbi:MAG: DNA alkylation repair protein [Candidatus Saliniplasma sp.]
MISLLLGRGKFKEMIIKHIENESGSKALNRVSRKVFPELPEDNQEAIELFDDLVSMDDWSIFWMVTLWIKRRELYDLEFMEFYERWLYEHIDHWGKCDVYCYRVLNPMLEKHPQLFEDVMKWTGSSKTYVRRAAPVSLLQSTRSFKVNQSSDRVFKVVEKLKHDEEVHVQKGVGWLLKYAYLSYPEEVQEYLKNDVDDLPRVIFRYALEKMPEDVRNELMGL